MEGFIRIGVHIFYHDFFLDLLGIFFCSCREDICDESGLIDMGVEVAAEMLE